ncbi:hypothetical protein EBZ80_21210 [bacterium]|nr:hypothetical protein [bacterium]
MKVFKVCHRCGSDRISAEISDATAIWDYGMQEWIMSEDYAANAPGYCAACDDDCEIVNSDKEPTE